MKGMPYLYRTDLLPFPWDLIAPHEEQARKNHGQSLLELAQRGGLSPCEMLAILEDRPWRKMPETLAIQRLTDIVEGMGAIQ